MTIQTPAAPAANTTTPPAVPAPAPAAAPAAQTPPPAAPPALTVEAKPEAAKSLLGDSQEPPKPGEAKPGEGKAIEYTDFTMPDGIAPDAKLLDGFKTLAKEAGLSQEAAQKFVTLQSENVKAGMEAMVKEAEVQKGKMLEQFKNDTIKELGPEYQKELGFAARALNRFGTPELRKLMDDTGLGNHPLLVKAWVAIGKTMAEDTPPGPAGSQPADSQEAQMRQMFPTMFNGDGTRKR